MAARSSSSSYGPFLILGSVVLVVAALRLANAVLIPVALAIMLTFILAPVVMWLQRHGLNRVAAVTVVVFLTFALLGAFFWEILQQVSDLSHQMAANSARIANKFKDLQGGEQGMVGNFLKVFHEVSKAKDQPTGPEPAPDEPAQTMRVVVTNVEPVGALSWFPTVAGPAIEMLASAVLVFMLVVFMLVRREDLRDRLFGLFGHGRVMVTTRALDEATQRISRYLGTLLAINSCFGGAFAVVLFLLGVPYALLWGFLTGALRFVPYIGTWLSLLLPLTFSVAIFDTWTQPILIAVTFTVLELATANLIEPLLYSHSTGISQVALLVAAAFWTWLWGPIGLVLSTPLSVCLVVLGKYVPRLDFFDVLLGDDPVLTPPVSFYQRLLAKDQDEASEVVEEQLQQGPIEGIYDRLLLPALVLARGEQERGELPAEDLVFINQVTREVIDNVIGPQQQIHKIATEGMAKVHGIEPIRQRTLVMGFPARDEMDELALLMLAQLLGAAGCQLDLVSSQMLSAEMVAQVSDKKPTLVCMGSVGPGGLAQARYLCKRLSAQFPDVKILVGRWGHANNVEAMRERLRAAGAYQVGTSLLELRDFVLPLLPVVAVTNAPEDAELARAR